MMKKFLVAAALSALLAGCATPARIDQMVSLPTVAVATDNPFRGQVAVKDVTGGRETNPMWTSQIGTSDFEQALEKSLIAAGLGAPRQAGKFTVTADMVKVEQPLMGIDMTVTAHVHYIVVERASGRTVFDKVEAVPYTAKFSDAFLGMERLKLANEGAAKVSIQQFIADLLKDGISGISMK